VTLRARLVLALFYVLLLALVALAIPLALNVERRARSDFEARIGGQAQVIAASLSDALTRPNARTALSPVVADYARELGGRVIVIDRGGVLVADSTRSPAPRESYASRPEVARALDGERVRLVRDSDELGRRYLFMAVPIVRGDQVLGVVRVSQPTEEIDSRVRRSWIAFAVVSFLILLVGSVVAWALGTSLARPLRALAASANRLARGDLSARRPSARRRPLRPSGPRRPAPRRATTTAAAEGATVAAAATARARAVPAAPTTTELVAVAVAGAISPLRNPGASALKRVCSTLEPKRTGGSRRWHDSSCYSASLRSSRREPPRRRAGPAESPGPRSTSTAFSIER
jgi:HAMP domain-containing protein